MANRRRQISPTEAQAFSYTGRIQSLQDATKDSNAHAGALVDKDNGDRRHRSLSPCLGWASRRRKMLP